MDKEAAFLKSVREYVLEGTFVEGISSSIRHSMRSFQSSKMYAALQKLPYKSKYLKKTQQEARKVAQIRQLQISSGH